LAQDPSNSTGLAEDSSEPEHSTHAGTATETAFATDARNEALTRVYGGTGPDSGSSTSGKSSHAGDLTKGLQDLARWAFGPKGLLSLQMIALGDFSYKGRYAKDRVILVRNDGQREIGFCTRQECFHLLSPTDGRRVALVNNYEYALGACPASHLLDYD
jgi:hypothetical protein